CPGQEHQDGIADKYTGRGQIPFFDAVPNPCFQYKQGVRSWNQHNKKCADDVSPEIQYTKLRKHFSLLLLKNKGNIAATAILPKHIRLLYAVIAIKISRGQFIAEQNGVFVF